MSSDSTVPAATAPVPDVIITKLVSLGLSSDQAVTIKNLGAESVEDLSSLKESDLVTAGIPTLKARKIIAALRPAVAATAPGVAAASTINFDSILPGVPDDKSWLDSLRTGGVLKIEESTVIGGVRATLADMFNFYDIPQKLVKAMEDYVDVTDEQVSEEFWKIRKQLTRRSYGDLFSAIDGMDGTFVTERRKNELLSRIRATLWPAIVRFQETLTGWQESWMQGSANPAAMIGMILAANSGSGGMLPPGMMQPPDCGMLRDAAEAVNDSINKAFRGTGVQIVAALAYEANGIKGMLDNTRLPILCGVPSRDLLLKKLGVSVPATYPRMEQNLTKYVLGIMQVNKIAAGNEELQYFGTLYMLGSQIPWSDLGATTGRTRPRGIGAVDAARYVDDIADNEEDEPVVKRKPVFAGAR